MTTPQDQNDLAYLLHKELLKTAEKFSRKCPKAGPDAILGAGNAYIVGFLLNAPSKEEARQTLASCYQTMLSILERTPAHLFGPARRGLTPD